MRAHSHLVVLRMAARTTVLALSIMAGISANAWAAPLVNYFVSQAPAAAANLRAGAARVDITPTDLTNLNPFNGGKFTGVHDPIFARVLVLDDVTTMVAFVALDLIEVGDTTDVRQRIQRELGIPVDHILINASHDHSAPRAGSVTPGGLAHGATPETLSYSKVMYDKVLGALKQAKASLQPAKFGFATGSVDVNVNRDQYTLGRGWGLGYDPDGISDKTVSVLKFESENGQPIAILFNYAVHSTAMFNTAVVSGDLAGAAERTVEQKIGNNVVALYTMGAAGDQIPKVTGTEGTRPPARQGGQGPRGGQGGPGGAGPGGGMGAPPTPERIAAQFEATQVQGYMLAAEVARLATAMQDMTGVVRIRAAERVVNCPVKQGTSQMADMKQQQATTMPLHLGLIQLNDVALVGVSGEVVTKIYWHLKRTSPLRNTVMLTIANDRLGYIADDAAYDMPLFEVNGSPLARGCAENAIVNNLTEMIKANE
jgi:neutral ceramidase